MHAIRLALLWLLILTLALPPGIISAATKYVKCTGGTGATCSSGSPCLPSTVWSQIAAGDTVIYKNDAYTGSSCMLRPTTGLSGSSGLPITVQAETPGSVWLNGQRNSATGRPIHLDNNDWFVIQDIDASSSAVQVVYFSNGTSNSILERGIFWDADDDTNSHVLQVAGSSANNTIRLNAFFGTGRKKMEDISGQNNFYSRNFYMHGCSLVSNGNAATTAYNTTASVWANNIGTIDIPSGCLTGTFVITPDHYQQTNPPFSTTNKMLGNITYRFPAQTTGSLFSMSRFSINPASVPTGVAITTVSRNNIARRHNTPNPTNSSDCPQDGVKSICDQSNNLDSFNALNVGPHTLMSGGTITPSATPDLLGLQFANQAAAGSRPWVKHCYLQDGTVDTGCNLWPWPQAARLKARLQSTSYAGRGIDGSGELDLNAVVQSTMGSTFATPLNIAFTNQPQNTVAGGTIPGIQACVYDNSSPPVPQINHANNLVIAIQTNPASGTLSGTLSIAPTNGCVTWNTLSINNAGVGYTLRATSTGATQVDTNTFDITAPAPPVAGATMLRSTP